MPARFHNDRVRAVLASVEQLLAIVMEGERRHQRRIDAVDPTARASARNLAHYLAVRNHDLRLLQSELAGLSLSSLGRMESHVHEGVYGVRLALLALLGELPAADAVGPVPELQASDGDRLLSAHAEHLLGASPPTRSTRIMVTMPSAAAHDEELVRALLRAGMTVARINLAHDDLAAWTAMVEHVRAAERAMGKRCRVLADLPGPKLRTGALMSGPEVLRVKPTRDAFGVVVGPARLALADPGATPLAAKIAGDTLIPLREPISGLAAPGDELVVTDTRGRRRRLAIVAVGDGACRAVADRSCYFGSGCAIELRRDGERLVSTHVGSLPAQESVLSLAAGDLLQLTRSQSPGRPARVLPSGEVEPARIPCTLPDVFAGVREGQRILFDDGKIAGVVVANDGESLRVRIERVPPSGGRLRAGKGINLPDTELDTPALDAHDTSRLDWIAHHADLASLSFVQRPADVDLLAAELAARGRADAGIVLKIETAVAFQRLPELLFAGMRSPPLGVMVARGDLAVELGYARLGEVQEEILWLCEAAHVPVIWATQVLDSMARTGQPSRAEVTDAAMGGRAECVMLNKGPYIVETVEFLGGVLERMQDHQIKKRAQLRRLRVVDDRAGPDPGGTGSGASSGRP